MRYGEVTELPGRFGRLSANFLGQRSRVGLLARELSGDSKHLRWHDVLHHFVHMPFGNQPSDPAYTGGRREPAESVEEELTARGVDYRLSNQILRIVHVEAHPVQLGGGHVPPAWDGSGQDELRNEVAPDQR